MESIIIVTITGLALAYLGNLFWNKYSTARAIMKSSSNNSNLKCLGCLNCTCRTTKK